MKNLIFTLIFIGMFGGQSALSKTSCDKEKQERLNQQINDRIIQTVIKAIDFDKSALHLKIGGDNETKLGMSISVYLKINKNLFFNIVGDGLQVSEDCVDREKLNLFVNLDTKDLIFKATLKEKNNKGIVALEFASFVNAKSFFQLQKKPLVAKLVSTPNDKLVEFKLHTIEISYDRSDEKRIAIDSTCKLTAGNSPVLAKCYYKGVIEEGNSDVTWGIELPEPNLYIMQ